MTEKEIVIQKHEERKLVKTEAKELNICPECSVNFGEWEVVFECDCGCGEEIAKGNEVICSEGRHYLKECFKQMKEDGLVEEEIEKVKTDGKN